MKGVSYEVGSTVQSQRRVGGETPAGGVSPECPHRVADQGVGIVCRVGNVDTEGVGTEGRDGTPDEAAGTGDGVGDETGKESITELLQSELGLTSG